MEQDFPGFKAINRASLGRVAVLADGENISFEAAQRLMMRIETLGKPTILRAYCDRANPNGWDRDCRFQITYLDTVSGKNSADIRLVIDAMDIAHANVVHAVVLLSTDCDFAPLAHRLRSFGLWVLGAGRAETSVRFRSACSEFYELEQAVVPPKPAPTVEKLTEQPIKAAALSKLDAALHRVCRKHGGKTAKISLKILGNQMPTEEKISRAETGKSTWRAYLQTKTDLYLLEGSGQTATVRLTRP